MMPKHYIYSQLAPPRVNMATSTLEANGLSASSNPTKRPLPLSVSTVNTGFRRHSEASGHKLSAVSSLFYPRKTERERETPFPSPPFARAEPSPSAELKALQDRGAPRGRNDWNFKQQEVQQQSNTTGEDGAAELVGGLTASRSVQGRQRWRGLRWWKRKREGGGTGDSRRRWFSSDLSFCTFSYAESFTTFQWPRNMTFNP